MKKCLLMPLACLALHAHAATYYLSSSGDDARSPSAARNPATPWRSIEKINSFFVNLQPGDSILFKRGETFYGRLDVGQSGTASRPIVISAYGSGAKPVITGFTLVSDWVNVNTGIWESTRAVSTFTSSNMVVINDAAYAMGRYPNADAPNKGYLTIDSHKGSKSITCGSLPSFPDWDGARVVVRTKHYILDTSVITSHSGTTIQYDTPLYNEPTDGYGFFIENHPRTLDQFGEWYYNPKTKKIRVFLGSMNPDAAVVKVATIDTLVNCHNEDYITFDNLSVQGANGNGITFYSAKNIHVQNCDVLFCGNAAIDAGTDDVSPTIENNLVADIGNYGIDMRFASKNQTIRNNTVKRIGLFPGMGGFGTQSHMGIVNNSSQNHLIAGNRIDSVGYLGICFGSDYTVVKNNVVSNFTMVLDDGGGIYTSNHGGNEHVGQKVLNNLVYNGIGAAEGTPQLASWPSSGIYIDDNSSGIEIAGNSVWNCGKVGLYLHNAFKINVHDNTFYNNRSQVLLSHDNSNYPALSNVTLKHNIAFAKTADQDVAYFYTILNDIASFGTIDSNYYARPVDDDTTIIGITGLSTDGAVKTKYTLAAWTRKYGKDKASRKAPKSFPITINPDDSIRFEYNMSNTSRTIALNGSYMDVEKNVYTNSIVIKPYTSAVLLRSKPALPVAPIVSLTSPTTNTGFAAPATITITAAASDVDGSISKVEFYNGTTLLGIDTASPYTFTLQNAVAGKYPLTAKATDNSGMTTTSPVVSISVINTKSKAPSVSLTNPVATASYIATSNIEIDATAADEDGSIRKVEFYNGTKLLSTVTTSPYKYVWQNVAAGAYSITAKATDNSGLSTVSSIVSVVVIKPTPPIVNLTSPSTESHYGAHATIELAAEAIDSDGTISKVEFYDGPTLLATTTTAPYTFSWHNVAAGSYTFTAKAVDNTGMTTTSAAVSLHVAADVGMRLTPNPVSNTLYITLNGLEKNKDLKISIVTVSGIVLKTIQGSTLDDQVIEVDVSNLPRQVYFLQATSGFTILNTKFIKL